MAKIAYIGLPAHGHTNPVLPIVKQLVENGHEVLFYNAESFRDKVEPTGVNFKPLPEPLPTEKEIAESMHNFINASLMFSKMSRPLTRYLIDELAREKPDLVLYDSAAMWGYISARINKIPQACIITTFVLDGSQNALGWGPIFSLMWHSLPHIPKLLRWRRGMAKEFGPENSAGITDYADLNLVLTSQEFHPSNTFVDERFEFVGPAIEPSTRQAEIFPFDLLSSGKKVYISLGTINHLNLDFYQNAFRAFETYPAQFILSAGKNTDLDTLGPIPKNFIVRNFVPQLEILQQVDVFITHGGMNSVHEGLYFGVPEIVIPSHFEQLLNGKRVVETGCGILLGSHKRYGKAAAEELRGALKKVLNDPSYAKNAQQIGRTLKDAGGYQQAVSLIENYLAT